MRSLKRPVAQRGSMRSTAFATLAGLVLGTAIGATLLLWPSGRATGSANARPSADPARLHRRDPRAAAVDGGR